MHRELLVVVVQRFLDATEFHEQAGDHAEATNLKVDGRRRPSRQRRPSSQKQAHPPADGARWRWMPSGGGFPFAGRATNLRLQGHRFAKVLERNIGLAEIAVNGAEQHQAVRLRVLRT